MNWEIQYLDEAKEDLRGFDAGRRAMIVKAIRKVSQNPLPTTEGGLGKPLGHRGGRNLTGLLKIKLRGEGIRVVYRLIRTAEAMQVVVIGIREDDEVYDLAAKRIR